MKRILTAVLVMLMAASVALAGVPDKPDTFAYAYDFGANVLDADDIEEISQWGAALEEATDIQVIAVVVDFLDGMDAADYATDLINKWGIGSKDDEGAVILLSRGDREIFIGTGKGIDRVMTGSKCGELIDQNIDYFASNRFADGMQVLYEDVCMFLAKAEGKTLSLTDDERNSIIEYPQTSTQVRVERNKGGGFLDTLLGFIFAYIVISVIVNAIFGRKNSGCGGGCLQWLFLGWLFGGRNNRRPPRPPMSGPRGGFGGPRPPMGGGSFRPPRSGFGGFGGGASRGGGFRGGSFGGGGSRGGGGGRRF